MVTPAQIKKIHALKSLLKIDDEEYRSMLHSYVNTEEIPVWSSKDLTFNQASSFIDTLEGIVGNTPDLRAKVYASPRQIRFVTVLWRHVTRAKDEEGVYNTLHSFLRTRFHIRTFDSIPKKQISKVIKTLRIMTKNNKRAINHTQM